MTIQYYGVSSTVGPGADNTDEWDFIQEVIKNLNFDDSIQLHVVSITPEWDYRDEVVLDNNKKNVIIGIKNEYLTDNIPQKWRDNATIFKAYLLQEQEHGSVHSLPLGYNKKHKKLVNRPITERPIDVFFAGNVCSANRRRHVSSVIDFFEKMPKQQRPYLDFNITRGFNVGLDADTYSQKLHDSKIVVCPVGNVSVETFRHYEAMRSGAIVVSPKLPETKIYKDAAICQVEDWNKDVGNVIMDLLSDLDMLQLVQTRQQQTYDNRYKAESVAKYITDIIMENTCYEFLSATK